MGYSDAKYNVAYLQLVIILFIKCIFYNVLYSKYTILKIKEGRASDPRVKLEKGKRGEYQRLSCIRKHPQGQVYMPLLHSKQELMR